jgi:autotransporter-associated beta strand protein
MFSRQWWKKLGRSWTANRPARGRQPVRFIPQLETLETRIVPTVNFYWKLTSTQVDPANVYSGIGYNYSETTQDGNATETITSSLSVMQDSATYDQSDTFEQEVGTPPPNESVDLTLGWSGAPTEIDPGQSFTITCSATGTIANETSSDTYGTGVDLWAKLDTGIVQFVLDTSSTGTAPIETDASGNWAGSESQAITFTPPLSGILPNPVGPPSNIDSFVIDEAASLGGAAVNTTNPFTQYTYTLEQGSPGEGGGGGGGSMGTPQLQVKSQPPDEAMVNQPFGLTVSELGTNGKVDTQFNGPVTITLNPNPSSDATLGGTDTVNAVNGVATFKNVTLDDLGDGFTLQASATGATPVTTNAFDVVDQVTLTWTGAGNGKWSDPNDWVNDNGNPQAPSGAGEDLVFPDDALRTTNVDDVPNLAVASLAFATTYDVSGDALDLTGDLTVSGGDPIFSDPTELDEVAPALEAPAFTPFITQDITINIAVGAQYTLKSVVDGPGGLIVNGLGELVMDHANTYSGGTTLQLGTLTIDNADALGTGPLNVPGTLNTLNAASALTLKNDVNLAGTTLNVTGESLTLAGTVTATSVAQGNGEIDPSPHSVVTLTGSINGNLQVGGTGQLVLNGALGGSVTTVVGATPLLEFGDKLSGSGLVTLRPGATLASNALNSAFAGDVFLEGGTVQIKANNALGSGTLNMQPANADAVSITTSQFSLANPVNLNGGTLNVTGDLTLTGAITLAADTIVNATDVDAAVTLNGAIGGSGTLTVQGPGQVILNGALGSSITVAAVTATVAGTATYGTVTFGSHLSGTGSVYVSGGTLYSPVANKFMGAITLTAGTLKVGANNAIGQGNLFLSGVPGPTTIDPMGRNIALPNPVFLSGGAMTIAPGNLQLSGSVSTLGYGEFDPADDAVVTLSGNIGVGGGGSLTVGGKGTVKLAGVLSSNVIVGSIANGGGNVDLTHTFSGSGGITVSQGGQLDSDSAVTYAGDITIETGGLVGADASAALGTGALIVPNYVAATLKVASNPQLTNGLTMNGGKLTVDGTANLTGAVTVNAAAEIDPQQRCGHDRRWRHGGASPRPQRQRNH